MKSIDGWYGTPADGANPGFRAPQPCLSTRTAATWSSASTRRCAHSPIERCSTAARLGLHPTDLTCLDLLGSRGPMTPGHLAAETSLTPGAITAAVDRLERK